MRTQQAGQSALLFLDAVEILQREKVKYAVIGAVALSVHGIVRGTTDVDAVLFTQPKQLAKLQAAFDRAGFRTERLRADYADPIRAMLVLNDFFDNRVELLGELRAMGPDVFTRTVVVPFMGTNLHNVLLAVCRTFWTRNLHTEVRRSP